jgi:hypothetical protein
VIKLGKYEYYEGEYGTEVKKTNGYKVEVDGKKPKSKYFNKTRAEMPKLKSVDMDKIKEIYPKRKIKLV